MGQNKKIAIFFSAAIVIGIMFFWVYKNYFFDNKNKPSVNLGAILTLTGEGSYWSYELKKGMDIASELINSNTSLTHGISVKYEDNAFNSTKAISAFKKMNFMYNIDAFISCFTPMCEVLGKLCEENHKPILLTITSATNIASDKTYVFRDYITQQQQCPPLAEYVYNHMGLKKGAYLVLNDDYGRDGVDEFTKTFNLLGGEIVSGEYFSRNDMSVRDTVAKILSMNPDFIFVIAGDKSLLMACNQIREINKNVQIIGLTSFDSEDIWNNLNELGDQIVFSSGYISKEYEEEAWHLFFDKFKEKYGKEPNATNVYGFSIVQYLFTLVVKSQLEGVNLEECLSKMQETSLRGELHMNENHDVLSPIGIYQRLDNKSVLRKVVL